MSFTRAGAILAVFAACTAAAGTARADVTMTLQALQSGGPVTVGNATYSNFVVPDASVVDPAHVQVTISSAFGESKISFAATPGPWVNGTTPETTGGLQVQYDVTFTNPVVAVDLDFDATGSPGAVASVGESIYTLGSVDPANLVASMQLLTDGTGPITDVYTTAASVAPSFGFTIQKSGDTSGAVAGASTLTSFDNVYVTVPEPASLGLLGLGGLVLMRRRSRA